MQNNQRGSVALWITLGLAVIFFIALAAWNIMNPVPKEFKTSAWNQAMTKGVNDAGGGMVKYTDYFCSFCTEMHQQTKLEKFQTEYIDSKKLHYEERPVAILKEISPNAEQGVQAAYCAADQNKYWQFSDDIIPRIKEDFFDKGIGVKNVAIPKDIPIQDLGYFSQSARTAGMNEPEFNDCMKSEKHKSEIEKNTTKALQAGVTGLPAVYINNQKMGAGFQGGWDGLVMLLKAGGIN